ncbi:MAG: Ig-like domain-containing protein, partial [Gemmatimonadota bacterium]
MFAVRRLLVLFLSASLAACSGDGGIAGNAAVDTRVAAVRVVPNAATVMAGRQLNLNATALNAAGGTVLGQPFSWTSSAPNIAIVDAAGTVTAVAPGTVTISATAAGIAGTSAVTVTQDTVIAAVTLAVTAATLPVGGTITLGAAARNAAGDTVFRQTFTWTSSAPNIATVNTTGLVTALAVGSATITASTAGRSASAAINVIAAPSDTVVASVNMTLTTATVLVGSAITLGAVAHNAAGQSLPGKPMTWSSAAPGLAAVNASGVVTGVAAGGPVIITATSQGKSATATVTVAAPPTSTGTITVNGAQQFQTMTGWEALMEIGQAECDPRAYQTYKNEVLDRAAFELGINRIRVGLRNG